MNLLLGISNPRIQMDEKQHLLPGPENVISQGRQHSVTHKDEKAEVVTHAKISHQLTSLKEPENG